MLTVHVMCHKICVYGAKVQGHSRSPIWYQLKADVQLPISE